MKITEQERALIIRRSAYAWSHFQENESGEEILCKIYCKNIVDKSPKQGAMMAKELLLWLARFQDCYDAALEDPDACTEYVLTKEIEALSIEQQCQTLHQVIQTMESESTQGQLQPYCGSPSPQARDALLRETVEKITSGSDAAVPERILLAADDSELQNRKLVKTLCGEDMVLAVNAMIIYTMAKNGELSGIPKDVSLAQVVIGVCTEDLFRGISRDEQGGYLTKEAAGKRKHALAVAFKTMMLAASAALAGGLAMLLCGAGSLGALSIGTALLAALGGILTEKFEMDRRMMEGQEENVAEILLKLPRSAEAWVRKKTKQMRPESLQEAAAEQETVEEQEDTDDSVLRLF